MNSEFVHALLILAYLIAGTFGIAFMVSWALKNAAHSAPPPIRALSKAGNSSPHSMGLANYHLSLDYSEVIIRLQKILSSTHPILRLRSILVPMDFTESSMHSLALALYLQQQFGCTVTLLHAIHLNIVGEERGVPLRRFLEEMKQAAEQALQAIVASSNLGSARIAVRVEEPVSAILQEATQSEIDLIIMGRHETKGFRRLLVRSVWQKVIHRAACPTLVV